MAKSPRSGLSGLFQTLALKGMLESTAVFVTGEFGRTPVINMTAGRDHYPRGMFCLPAGGGMRCGQVIGASDEKARRAHSGGRDRRFTRVPPYAGAPISPRGCGSTMHGWEQISRKANIENSMKTTLPTLFAAAALLFAACEAKVNTTPAPSTEKNTTIVTPGAEPKKTETNTTTTVTPSGVNQTTTTEKK